MEVGWLHGYMEHYVPIPEERITETQSVQYL